MSFSLSTFSKSLKAVFTQIKKDQAEAINIQVAANFIAGQTAAEAQKSTRHGSTMDQSEINHGNLESEDPEPEEEGLSDEEKLAIAALIALYLGYTSKFNDVAQAQILSQVSTMAKGGSSPEEIQKYVDDVFSGNENITIDNTGKKKKEIYVDKDLKISEVSKTITKPFVTSVLTYASLVGENASHEAYEAGRKAKNISNGYTDWVFVGPADERARPWHVALLGEVFTWGTEQSEYAEKCLSEPRCRHRSVPYYGDDRDTPKAKWDELKKKNGLQWDEDAQKWTMDAPTKVPKTPLTKVEKNKTKVVKKVTKKEEKPKNTPAKRTPEEIENTIKEHQDKIKNRKTEKAYIFDKNGNTLVERKGTKNQVEFLDEDEKFFKGNIILHNHPSGMSFSKQDILNACDVNTNEERVTGKYGTYILKLKDGSNFNKGLWDEKISAAYDKHYTNVIKELNIDIQRGKVTKEAADKVAMNKVWTRVAGDVEELDYNVIWED